jgi:hydroxymethylpyrimidine/phosphomethylpyrimidine kinase
MNRIRTKVLSIAGFDPSAGAGVLADIKTFEMHKVYGLGVVSSLTIQNEKEFLSNQWVPVETILQQVEVLLKEHKVEFVKIGLIESYDVLLKLTGLLKGFNPNVKIIWDPVIKASAGFTFHEDQDQEKICKVCSELYMITPNWQEIQFLVPNKDPMEAGKYLSRFCHVYLKGGHNSKNEARDYLLSKEGKVYPFKPKTIVAYPKHGSGCVLSSAITANLSKGYPLIKACIRAKDYITRFLASNETLLGNHKG